MITAIDSNVIIDVLNADAAHGEHSRRAIREAANLGRLVASDIVWAEICGTFSPVDQVVAALERLRVEFDPLGPTAAAQAGERWRAHRRKGGTGRVIADFLIGAHAMVQADRLLTRDRGFTIHDPSKR